MKQKRKYTKIERVCVECHKTTIGTRRKTLCPDCLKNRARWRSREWWRKVNQVKQWGL